MRISTNIPALHAHQQLLEATAQQAKAAEREVMRIGEQTSFNGIPLLDRIATIPFQVGDRDGDAIEVETPSLRSLFAVGIESGLRAFEYYAKPFDTTIDMVARSLGPDMHTPVDTPHSYVVPANATMEDVVAIINADPASPVQAVARYDAQHDSYAFGFYNKGRGTTFDTVASGGALEEWNGYDDRYPGVDAYPVFDLGDPDDIAQIDDAISAISGYRGEFGAAQTRIERAVRNVLTQQESLTAAESRIRDADVAQEVVEMARAGILAGAATSMLAQANQVPQLVLSLLRN